MPKKSQDQDQVRVFSWTLWLLLVLVALYMFCGHRAWLNIYDEGITLSAADRILRGQQPFRDFWSNFPPGQYYFLAAVFRIFGNSLAVARVVTLCEHFAIVLSAYFLARRLGSRNLAMLSLAGCALWLEALKMYESPTSPAMLLSFLGVLALARWFERQSPGALVWSGALTGLAALFRHDLGCDAFLSASAGIILFGLFKTRWSQPQASPAARRKPAAAVCAAPSPVAGAARCWGLYSLGLLSVVSLPACLLLYFGPWDDLWLGLVRFSLSIYPKYMRLPYPSLLAQPLQAFPFYLPFLVYGAAAIKLLRRARARCWSGPDWLGLVLLVMGISFCSHVSVRSDAYHLTTTLLVSFILLPWLALGREGRVSAYAWIPLILLIAWGDSEAVRSKIEMLQATPERFDLVPLDLPRGGWALLPRFQARFYERAVRETQACAGPDGKIFSGSLRYDVGGSNDVMFYYLSERTGGTRYYFDVAGVTMTRPVQERMIHDLESNQVSCMMLWAGGAPAEPNAGSVSSGVTELDRYIRAHFKVYDQFWNYVLLRRAG